MALRSKVGPSASVPCMDPFLGATAPMRRAPDKTCQSYGKRPVPANGSGPPGDPEPKLREARLFLFGKSVQNVTGQTLSTGILFVIGALANRGFSLMDKCRDGTFVSGNACSHARDEILAVSDAKQVQSPPGRFEGLREITLPRDVPLPRSRVSGQAPESDLEARWE